MNDKANFDTKMPLFHLQENGDSDQKALTIINEISSIIDDYSESDRIIQKKNTDPEI